jgi:hypothetical protein
MMVMVGSDLILSRDHWGPAFEVHSLKSSLLSWSTVLLRGAIVRVMDVLYDDS